MPLVLWRGGRDSLWIGMFLKDQLGCEAGIAQRAMFYFTTRLNLKGSQFLPSGKNEAVALPYHGGQRVAFGAEGQELSIDEFVQLVRDRATHATDDFKKTLKDWFAERAIKDAVADKALAYVDEKLASTDAIPQAERDEFYEQVRALDRDKFAERRAAIAKKLKIGVADLNAVLKQRNDQERQAERKAAADAFEAEDSEKRLVWGGGEVKNTIHKAEKILAALPNKFFEKPGRLVTPQSARQLPKIVDANGKELVERDRESLVVNDATIKTLQRDLDEHAEAYIPFESGGVRMYQRVIPPEDLCKHLVDRVSTNPNEVPYPHLDMLTQTPTLLPSLNVHDAPGELREGVLFLASRRVTFPKVEVQPSREDAIAALAMFKDIFGLFPFVQNDPSGERMQIEPLLTPSYSVVLAANLTIAARAALPTAVPFFGVRAHTPRTGKTRIVDATTIAMTGCKPTKVIYKDEIEFNKMLLPIMLHEDRVVLADNVDVVLRSAKLAALITDNFLQDRVLGYSRTVDIYNRSVLFATGNQLSIGGDLTVRALQCYIDAGLARPEERDFGGWLPENRARERHPQLLHGVLLALRAYVSVGKPWELPRKAWGGFENWDQLVVGCLVWCGYTDPYVTRQDVLSGDAEREEGEELLSVWFEEHGDRALTLGELGDATKHSLSKTREALGDAEGKWNPQAVGSRLRRLQGVIQGGLKLMKVKGPGGGGVYWKVVRVGTGDSSPRASKTPYDEQGDIPF